LLLLGWSWRVLRHPDRNAPAGRLAVGWIAVLLGVLGLVHVAHGTPQHADGADAMRAAGGWLGWLAASPLVAGVTAYLAAPLLVLLVVFGLLVLTGTPLHQVPTRWRALEARLLRRTDPPAAGPEVIDLTAQPEPLEPLRRSRIRRRARWWPTSRTSPQREPPCRRRSTCPARRVSRSTSNAWIRAWRMPKSPRCSRCVTGGPWWSSVRCGGEARFPNGPTPT